VATPGDPTTYHGPVTYAARPPRAVAQPVDTHRARRILGGVLLLLGITVVIAALVGRTQDDERPVGVLIGSNLASGGPAAPNVLAPAPAPASDEPTPASGPISTEPQWPAPSGGRPVAFGPPGPPPASAEGIEPGFYLWFDFNGWHVFLVGGDEGDVLTFTSDDDIAKAEPTGGDPAIDVQGKVVRFSRGAASEPIVGADLNPGFFAKSLQVSVDGDLPLRLGIDAVPSEPSVRLDYAPPTG
jgi:hypothetical protein